VHSIIEINVDVSMPEKQRAVAGCGAAKMMPRGITWRIAFRFDDPAAKPSLGQIVDHDLADQKPGELQGVAGKFRSSEAAKFEMCAFHGLLRAYIRRLVVKKPREFRMVDHHGGIHLNGVIVFLLESITRFRRSKHFARQRDGGANVFRRNGIFTRQRFIEPDDELGNIVKPPKLLVVNDQPEEFSHGYFAVGAFIFAAFHIQQRLVNSEQCKPQGDELFTRGCLVCFACR
jgi:hypothetical protein